MNKIIIGETCLLDKQLRKHGVIDSPHGCFDDVLINLDGLSLAIEDDFDHLLSNEFIKYTNYVYYPKHGINYDKWINLKYSIDIDNIYSWDVMSFFHLDTKDDWDKVFRRITRTKKWFEDDRDVLLFYYYRLSDNYNMPRHQEKLCDFIKKISKKYNKKFKCVNIMNNLGMQKIEEFFTDCDILSYVIHSNNSWIDVDDNWDGHLDDELFKNIFNRETFKNFIHV